MQNFLFIEIDCLVGDKFYYQFMETYMKNVGRFLVTSLLFNILSYSQDTFTISLDEFIRNHHEFISEGHICNGAKVQVSFFREFFKENPHIKTIGEIGFNAGHSSEIFLKLNPEIRVFSFDIMQHSYAKIGKKYIDLKYPKRHELIEGNSLISVPRFAQRNNLVFFDLIFIDGGHDFDTAFHDIVNMKSLASSNTLLVVDDINYKSVFEAWETSLRDGHVREIKRYKMGNKSWVVGQYCF